MASPPATPPTPAEIVAAPPDQRRAMIRAFTAPIFAAADREDARRLAEGAYD